MSDKTKIEWADATWNPIVGCEPISEGCQHCYAQTIARRFQMPGWDGTAHFSNERISLPTRWKRPRRIFVNSMGDLFHRSVPFDWLENVWNIMGECPQHIFMILTKRPAQMLRWFQAHPELGLMNNHDGSPSGPLLNNVWLGVSAENQKAAEERIPILLECPASVRFVSVEPMLGPVDLSDVNGALEYRYQEFHPEVPGGAYEPMYERGGIHWVICGGESGPHARPMHPNWVRSLRDQCRDNGIPFFFKQWGEWAPVTRDVSSRILNEGTPGWYNWYDEGQESVVSLRVGRSKAGNILDGRTWEEFPKL